MWPQLAIGGGGVRYRSRKGIVTLYRSVQECTGVYRSVQECTGGSSMDGRLVLLVLLYVSTLGYFVHVGANYVQDHVHNECESRRQWQWRR